MSLFTIDYSKCKRDGICIAECPQGIIEMAGEDAFPSPVAGLEQLCINCGHCVAVCPHGAFKLDTIAPQDCSPMNAELTPSTDQVRNLLFSRRSIRSYKNSPVDREVLTKLLDVLSMAPTAHNDQPMHWIVIEDQTERDALVRMTIEWMQSIAEAKIDADTTLQLGHFVNRWREGKDPILRGAPHVVIGHASSLALNSLENCSIALSYLELTAHSMGLGACWAGALQVASLMHPPLLEALCLPEGHQCYGAMMIGSPMYKYHRVPVRKPPSLTWR